LVEYLSQLYFTIQRRNVTRIEKKRKSVETSKEENSEIEKE
jgi:hypothetical protein